ncbi:MAG: PPC domain-containing protein, partial [Thermoplasmata archaeon]
MWKKTTIKVLFVCAIMALSVFAAAGLSSADGVNASVTLNQVKTGTLTAAGKIDYYYFALGTGYTSLTVKTYNTGTGYDFDLYVKRGAYPTTSSYDARGYTNSAAETITISNPASGTYYVMINSYSGGGTYSFVATAVGGTTTTPITINTAGASGSVSATGDKKYFSVAVGTGLTSLRVETYNPSTGFDLDLYVKLGALPTTSTYDGRGYTSSSAEVITLTNPAAGTYYIMPYSYSGAGTFSVKVTSTSSTSPSQSCPSPPSWWSA